MRAFGLFLSVYVAALAEARIGETPIQFVDRYGAPKDTASSKILDKNSPILEGAIHHTYEYQGWKIRAAFLQLDGPAVRMDFQKFGPDVQIKDYELEAIMKANTPSRMTWAPMAYDNPDSPNKGLAKAMESFVAVGQKMWRRSDGAILWLRSNLTVRLELPVAREYEAKLKRKRNRKLAPRSLRSERSKNRIGRRFSPQMLNSLLAKAFGVKMRPPSASRVVRSNVE